MTCVPLIMRLSLFPKKKQKNNYFGLISGIRLAR